MKYAQLVCDSEGNIGEDIQSLAAGLHLPRIDTTIDRDQLHQYRGEPVAMIMNGWFSANTAAWPPPPAITPIFVSFHIADRLKPAIRKSIDYLKRFEPIGVSDHATRNFLVSLGVKAETTYCLTLTFPQRPTAPRNGKVFLVDAMSIAVPAALRKGAVKIMHRVAPVGHEVTIPYARRLLELYRDNARLVITTRLHAALPCIAMGIPVIYFGSKSDGRTSILSDIGGTIYDRRLHAKLYGRGVLGHLMDKVDWSPAPLDVTAVKQNLTAAVASRLAAIEQSPRYAAP